MRADFIVKEYKNRKRKREGKETRENEMWTCTNQIPHLYNCTNEKSRLYKSSLNIFLLLVVYRVMCYSTGQSAAVIASAGKSLLR